MARPAFADPSPPVAFFSHHMMVLTTPSRWVCFTTQRAFLPLFSVSSSMAGTPVQQPLRECVAPLYCHPTTPRCTMTQCLCQFRTGLTHYGLRPTRLPAGLGGGLYSLRSLGSKHLLPLMSLSS